MRSFYINKIPTRLYKGIFWKAGDEPLFYTVICDCGRKIDLRKPDDTQQGGGKTHQYCKPCNLVWVRNKRGRIYSHAWKVNGVEYQKIPPEKRIEEFQKHHERTGQAI